MTVPWVSLASTPRSFSASQKRRAPPACGLSTMPTKSPLPQNNVRVAYRFNSNPDYRYFFIFGFRCAGVAPGQ